MRLNDSAYMVYSQTDGTCVCLLFTFIDWYCSKMSRSRGRRVPVASDRTWVATHRPDLEAYALKLCSAEKVPWTRIAKRLQFICRLSYATTEMPACGGLEQLIVWGPDDFFQMVQLQVLKSKR